MLRPYAIRPGYRPSLLAVLLAFSALPASAQEAGPDEVEPALQSGAWALQVGLASPLAFTSFQGGALSAKYHPAASAALRFGIQVTGDVGEDGSTVRITREVDVGPDVRERDQEEVLFEDADRRAYRIGVEAQYVAYPRRERAVKWFLGGGPTVSYQRDLQDQYREVTQTSQQGEAEWVRLEVTEERHRRRAWTAGGLVVVGGEWFAAARISLSAEYGVGAGYVRSHREAVQSTRVEEMQPDLPESERVSRITSASGSDGTGWRVWSRGVRVGLTLYL